MLTPSWRPWHAVQQWTQVWIPELQDWRTVVDPRGAPSTVVLRHDPTGRISIVTVDPNVSVMCLVPTDERQAVDVLRGHFEVEIIDG